MKAKTYVQVSGVLFFIVALLHLARALMGWQVVVGLTTVPLWVSWAAVLGAGYMAYYGLIKPRR